MSTKSELNRERLGQWSEQVVAEYLEQTLGWRILQRNWRCHAGELDIIAMDGVCTVIVEVRSRRSRFPGTPVEAVDYRKVVQLRRVAGYWLAQFPTETDLPDLRIDVIVLRWEHEQVAEMLHIRGAVSGD